MNYKLIYERLVKRGQERPKINGYKERHHIVPRCMGGGDEVSNLVDLTPEEHYVAHQLLVKIYPKNLYLVRACDVMSKDTKINKYWRKNKMYSWLRRRLHVPRVNNICKYCERSFEALKCHKRKFCSRACKYAKKRNRVLIRCKFCQKEFNVMPSEAKRRQYCSSACTSKSQRRYETKKCEYCESLMSNTPHIIKTRRFCSKECTDKFRKGKSTPPTRFAPIISKPCTQCGVSIYGKPGVLKQKTYCSVKCRGISQRKS